MADMVDYNQQVIAEFRANNGVVKDFPNGPLLLLHHVGRKSGKEFVTPLVYFTSDDGRRFIVASKGGLPENPEWYANILAAGQVTIEIGDHEETARVAEVPRAERDVLYPTVIVAQSPGFADYEKKTDRVIPIIELLPVSVS